MLHSMICFMFCKSAYGLGVEWASGGSGGYLVLGNIAYFCVMIIVNVKAGLEFVSWSWPVHSAIWGSIGKSSPLYNHITTKYNFNITREITLVKLATYQLQLYLRND